jgi:hypothetical protein
MRPILLLGFATSLAMAQEQDYFQEAPLKRWVPNYAIDAWTERIELSNGSVIQRSRGLLRLRWNLAGDESSTFQFVAGSQHRAGSDGNRNNLPRFDNSPSNGTRLDVAEARLRWLDEAGGAELKAGFLENPLLSSESLWDGDLRILGGGGRAFFRRESAGIDELGVRAVVGEVVLLNGGRVKLQAAQAVFRLQTGPIAWTAHGGSWTMNARQQDALAFRRQNTSGALGYLDPDFRFVVWGVGLETQTQVPFELKGLQHARQNSPGKGQELQAWLGSRSKVWWPQLGFIRQILPKDGALGSVNGDQWWFHSNADGERYVLALNLPQRWRLEVDFIEQRLRDGVQTSTPYPIISKPQPPLRMGHLMLRKRF